MAKGERTNTQLGRRKGLLVNRSVDGDSRSGHFLCDCDCGAKQVRVLRTSFNYGNVTACPECTEKGLAPNINPHHPKRLSVSLDAEALAALGFDAEEVTGGQVRQLLTDFGGLVAEAAQSTKLVKPHWSQLLTVVQTHPHLLDSDGTPTVRLLLIAEEAGLGGCRFNGLQALAVLAALRWGLTNGEGEWWRAGPANSQRKKPATSTE